MFRTFSGTPVSLPEKEKKNSSPGILVPPLMTAVVQGVLCLDSKGFRPGSYLLHGSSLQ